MKRFKTFAAAATIATLGFAAQALAHAHLKAAIPAENAIVTAPGAVSMTFSEPLELKMSSAMVMTPAGGMIDAGAPTLSADGLTLTLPLKAPLAAGDYGVMWQVLSTDGHKTSGNYNFTVK